MSMGRKIEPVTEVFWELSTLSWDDMGNAKRVLPANHDPMWS